MESRSELSELKTFLSIPGSRVQFIVPEYQRGYVWEKKDWKPFFRGLHFLLKQENRKQKYFLGTLNLIEKSKNRYEVVDGYQRLLTLSLFLLAARYWATANEKSRIRVLDLKLNFYPKLQQEFYETIKQKVLDGERVEGVLKDRKFVTEPVTRVFSESLKQVKKMTKKGSIESLLPVFGDGILFSVVFWDQSINGQAIFERTNLLGKKLNLLYWMRWKINIKLFSKDVKDDGKLKKNEIREILYKHWNNWDQEITENIGRDAFNDFVKVLKTFNTLPGQKGWKKRWVFLPKLSNEKDCHRLLDVLTECVSLYLLVVSQVSDKPVKESEAEKTEEIIQVMTNNFLRISETLEEKSNFNLGNYKRVLLFFLALCFEREVIDFAFFEKLVSIFTIYRIILDVGASKYGSMFYKNSVDAIRQYLDQQGIKDDYIFLGLGEKKTVNQLQEDNILKKVVAVLREDIKDKNVEWYEHLRQSFKDDVLSETVEEWFWRNSNQRFKITSKNILHFVTRREWKEEDINIEHINPQMKEKKKQRYIYYVGNIIYLERTLNTQASDETLSAKVEIYKQSKNKEVRELADFIERHKIENWDEQHIRKRGSEIFKKMFASTTCTEFLSIFFMQHRNKG